MIALFGEILTRNNPKYSRPAYEFDKNLIWRLKRNFTGTKDYAMGKVSPKRSFTLKFNNSGFRGDDILTKIEKNRILILGDSYTAGLDYPDEELFTSILEKKLNSINEEFKVINASCPAWGTDQEYIYWITEGIKLDPDYLVLVMAPNDIRESFNKKICVLKEDMSVQINSPSIPFKYKAGWKLANYSSFYQFMQKKWFYTNYGSFMKMYDFFPVNYGIEDSTNWDLPIFLREQFKEVEDSYNLVEQLIMNFKQSCDQHDIELIVAIIPSKVEFDGRLSDTIKYQPGKVADLIGDFTNKNEITILNLYDTVQLETNNPSEIFMDWEFHFNKEGHEFVANQLYKCFKKNYQN